MPDRATPEPDSSALQNTSPSPESDLGELAALFAAHSGGSFSAEVAGDLALEIVLNETVEQACLATGATGAAIILERDGEMVCRASSGVNAPQFGARLGSESGLTAECIRTRQVQRCEDALADLRADAEASRSLGVRSVLILPLLRDGGLAGLLEVFSSRPGAFGERDELTLEALAQRTLKNLERASETLSMSSIIGAGGVQVPAAKLDPPIAANSPEDSRAGSATSLNKEDEVTAETFSRSPRTRIDVVTFALGAAVVVCAVLLTTLVVWRVSSRKISDVREHRVRSASTAAVEQRRAAPDGAVHIAGEIASNAASSPASSKAGNSMAEAEKKNASAPPAAGAVRSKEPPPPEGGLLVFENGKEVFRMPPAAQGDAASATTANGSGVQRASAVESAGIVEISPEATDGSLLHRVEPEYPEEARQQRIQGSVALDVRIGRDGAMQEVKVVSGHRTLTDAAVAAVKQWRFKPRVLKGQPVEMQTRVTLNFRMPG